MFPMRTIVKSLEALRLVDSVSALRSGTPTMQISPQNFSRIDLGECVRQIRGLTSATVIPKGPEKTGDGVSLVHGSTTTKTQTPYNSLLPNIERTYWSSPFPSGHFPLITPLPVVPIQSPWEATVTNRLPSLWNIEKFDPLPSTLYPVEAPTLEHLKIEKQAARLIRIRRRKMKKHQYKKLRKRMGLLWDRIKLRRRLRRFKAFYAEQDLIITKAKEFSPEAYVRNYIAAAKASIIERAMPPPKPVHVKPKPWKPRIFR
ncbi:uncharacterized protein LOC129581467 [Paramacrobiotus metropolitanus]|uniref:uncharacterized protein LOC129581467 n=1 Tax=Paramacrobiotus metropolitanus TaxID=2943436 RepID=UPI002446194C|nr:uncharacterized protein LOC129581467 [Paramacrobiotus metropolitanus]